MLLGFISLFIGQIFGNTVVPIGTKVTSPFTGPFLFVFVRFLIATFLLFILFLFSPKKKVHKSEYKEFFILGLCLSINVILFTVGIPHTTIIMGSLIYSITPILVGILGHFYLDEKLDTQKILGFFIATVGLGFLLSQSFSQQHQQNAFGTPFGNICIFLAMLGYSYYVFQSRRVLHKKDHYPIQTTFLTFIFVTIISFVVLVAGIGSGNIVLHALPAAGVIGFTLVGIGSVAQYLTLQIGVKRTSAFTASLFQYVSPFIAGAVAIPLLHERLTWELVVGGILILLGVFIATTFEQMKRYIK